VKKLAGNKLAASKVKTRRNATQGKQDTFSAGTLVIVTLGNPREKFWGMILALEPAGLSLSGVELASLEDLAVRMKDGEPFSPAVIFFPMHRVERVELDLPNGSLPSLAHRFLSTTGMEPAIALAPNGENNLPRPAGFGAKDRA
jgi:hypothetical protein